MTLVELWLPILVAAVFVFVVSSIIHMALPIHKGDWQKLPNEADVMAAIKSNGVSRGHYMFPCAGSMKEASSPEMIEKFNKGPVGYMTVLPDGMPNMGKALLQWFVFCIVLGFFCAYVATLCGLAAGAETGTVFRVTGTVAILGYALGNIQDSIWKGLSWGITIKFVFDGVLYGLATGAAFAWLWPAAA